MRQQGRARKLFSCGPQPTPWPSPRRSRALCNRDQNHGACIGCEKKPQETSVFLFRAKPCARIAHARWRTRARAARAGRATRWQCIGKKVCVRLLTVEKTVIRFRPSRPFLQNQVSRTIATNSSSTRTSARTIHMVDAGSLSSAKRESNPFQQTRSARRCGFFVALAHGAGRAESVPVRFARRRLIAGPTPAVLL